ncbi:MAG: hypothetical protein J0H43_03505 [Actinobacteria bacterium]|nr:hypothetical protein [Actinomycetota bacterium]
MAQPREFLRQVVRTHRRDLLRASLLYTGHQVGEALVPVVVGAVIGQAIAHGGWSRIALWLGVLAVDFLALSMCYRFGARASMRAKQGTAHVARMWLVRRSARPLRTPSPPVRCSSWPPSCSCGSRRSSPRRSSGGRRC